MSTSEHRGQPTQEPTRSTNGCAIMLLVGLLILLGIVGWFFLWGRAIPAGEDSKEANQPKTVSMRLVLR